MNNNQKHSVQSNVIGILSIVGFLLAIIMILVFASSGNAAGCALIMGLLFATCGILSLISDKKKNWMGALFAFLGIVIALGGAFFGWGEKIIGVQKFAEFKLWFETVGGGICLGIAFVFAGLCMLFAGIVVPIMKKQRCTVEIQAMCAELKMRRGNKGRHLYAPVFTFYFDGTDYRTEPTTYSNFNVPNVGEEYSLFINPNEPTDFYRKSDSNSIFIAVMGFIFFAVGILATLLQTGVLKY